MAQPVVHFEIIGNDTAMLRRYYGRLFGWQFSRGDAVAQVSAPGEYGFVEGSATDGQAGINGGVAGGAGYERHVLFYVGVSDVEAALADAERLGGTRVLGPETASTGLVVGHFPTPRGTSSVWPRRHSEPKTMPVPNAAVPAAATWR